MRLQRIASPRLESDAIEESEHCRTRVLFIRGDDGTWFAVTRFEGIDRGFKYQENAHYVVDDGKIPSPEMLDAIIEEAEKIV